MLYSTRPRSYEKYEGMAIDKAGTTSREDCFQIQKDKKGVTMRIMVTIPPFQKVLEESLAKALRIQLNNSSQSNSFPIFHPSDKNSYGLQIGRPREVLIAEYNFDKFHHFKKESLYVGDVYLTKQLSFEEYLKSPGTNWHMEILSEAVKCKKHLQIMSKSPFLKKIRLQDGLGCEFVFMALELFNHTCRSIAKIYEIPFISAPNKNQKNGFLISDGYARFNHSLRNPCSFINIANITYHLSGKGLFLSKSELSEYLPKKASFT